MGLEPLVVWFLKLTHQRQEMDGDLLHCHIIIEYIKMTGVLSQTIWEMTDKGSGITLALWMNGVAHKVL